MPVPMIIAVIFVVAAVCSAGRTLWLQYRRWEARKNIECTPHKLEELEAATVPYDRRIARWRKTSAIFAAAAILTAIAAYYV